MFIIVTEVGNKLLCKTVFKSRESAENYAEENFFAFVYCILEVFFE